MVALDLVNNRNLSSSSRRRLNLSLVASSPRRIHQRRAQACKRASLELFWLKFSAAISSLSIRPNSSLSRHQPSKPIAHQHQHQHCAPLPALSACLPYPFARCCRCQLNPDRSSIPFPLPSHLTHTSSAVTLGTLPIPTLVSSPPSLSGLSTTTPSSTSRTYPHHFHTTTSLPSTTRITLYITVASIPPSSPRFIITSLWTFGKFGDLFHRV